MSDKPFPHYLEAAISLFVTRGDGELHQVLLVLGKCYDRTIEDCVNEILTGMETDGLRPVSLEEYATHARAMVTDHQHEMIATKLQDRLTNPEVMKDFLAGYMGRQGGDA